MHGISPFLIDMPFPWAVPHLASGPRRRLRNKSSLQFFNYPRAQNRRARAQDPGDDIQPLNRSLSAFISASCRPLTAISHGLALRQRWLVGFLLRQEKGFQHRDELPGVERLGQEVTPQGAVAPGRLLAIQGGDDDPAGRVRCPLVGAAEPVEDRSSLAIGELEVEDRGVRGLSLQEAQGFASSGYLAAVKPRLAQAKPQHPGYPLVILDDEYSRLAIASHRCHFGRQASRTRELPGR